METVYFIGKLLTDIPQKGDEIAYMGIDAELLTINFHMKLLNVFNEESAEVQ